MFLIKDSQYWVPFTTVPQDWVKDNSRGIEAYYCQKKQLYVISTKDMLDSRSGLLCPCHHVSLSRKNKPVKWRDICYVKDIFMGEEVEAFHVVPKHSEYVNLHPNCFHIWSWI